jgi:hypothetical protein
MDLQETPIEVPNRLAQLSKCAHGGCTCTVEPGDQYCSDYCAAMANGDKAADDDACNCGHAECAASAAPPGTPAERGGR